MNKCFVLLGFFGSIASILSLIFIFFPKSKTFLENIINIKITSNFIIIVLSIIILILILIIIKLHILYKGIDKLSFCFDYEKKGDFEKIWLITSDFSSDIPGSPFFDVVENNLKKGVKYVYFSPSTIHNKARIHEIQKKHLSRKENLHFIDLPIDFFILTPKFDYNIYFPNGNKSPTGYICLLTDNNKHINHKMDYELVSLLIGKLSGYFHQ